MRNRVETPNLFPADDVVGANVAGRGEIRFAGRRPQDDQVLEDLARVRRLHAPDFAGEPLPEVHHAVGAERQDRFAGLRVDRFEIVVALEQETPVPAIRTLPIVDTAWRDTLQVRMHPDFLPRGGVERHQGVVARQDERGVVDDQRTEVIGEVVSGRIGPGDIEPRERPLVDLIKLEVAAVVRPPTVILPGRAGGAPLASRTERDRQKNRRYQDRDKAPATEIRPGDDIDIPSSDERLSLSRRGLTRNLTTGNAGSHTTCHGRTRARTAFAIPEGVKANASTSSS